MVCGPLSGLLNWGSICGHASCHALIHGLCDYCAVVNHLCPGLYVVNPCSRGLLSQEMSAQSDLLECDLSTILDVGQVLLVVLVSSVVVDH